MTTAGATATSLAATAKGGGKSRLLVVLVVLAAVLAWAGPAGADPEASPLANQATAISTQGHPFHTDLAWAQALRQQGPSLTATNNALAVSHDCRGCVANAVAFQIVLASDTNIFVLTNNATSVNYNCETCTAVSVAEQWVVGATSQQVRLTPAGQFALAIVHLRLFALQFQPPLQALPQVLALADQVSAILAADVVTLPSSVPSPAAAAVTPFAQTGPPSSPRIQHFAQVST